MSPTHTHEGIVAAATLRDRYPRTGLLILSQYLAPRYAELLLSKEPSGVGYLLKERVSELGVLVDALTRIHGGAWRRRPRHRRAAATPDATECSPVDSHSS